jgi:hypothetical protein
MIGRRHRLIVEKQQQMLLNSQVVPEKWRCTMVVC